MSSLSCRKISHGAGAPTDKSCAEAAGRDDLIALIPLVLVIYYLLKEGLGSMTSGRLLHPGSDRQLLRPDPGGIRSRDPRLARDRRARDADRDSDRHRVAST
jgi:hypothetical protein